MTSTFYTQLIKHLKQAKTERNQAKELVIILKEKGVIAQADVDRIQAKK